VHAKPNFYRNDYFIVGADIRGIDQNTKLVNRVSGVGLDHPFFAYNEALDTTYYGGYIGIGGEYSFGFIPFLGSAVKGVGGIYDRFGLRTFINLRGGLYSAETDYHGRFAAPGVSDRPTRIEDDDAFATRTMLRLNIGLGSAQLYPAPPP
jgi:hypothetical protein